MNPLLGKKIAVVFAYPGQSDLMAIHGIFHDIISFSEADIFLVVREKKHDTLVNMNYILTWEIADPPKNYNRVAEKTEFPGIQ